MRRQAKLCAVGALALAIVGVGCSFAQCPPVNVSSDTLIAHVKRKSGIPPNVAVSIQSIRLVDPRTCVSKVEVATESPDTPFKASYFISSDNRLLMTDFDDLAADLREVDKRTRSELAAYAHEKRWHGIGHGKTEVVFFYDFECPYCRAMSDALLKEILLQDSSLKLYVVNYPLVRHPWARAAALVTECLVNENEAAFWKVYEQVFSTSERL